MPISGLGELSTQTRTLVKVTLQSRINGFQVNLDCLVIGKITQNIPVNRLSLQELRIPEGITLADPDFDKPSHVDLLLGAEVFFELLCIGKIKIADGQPTWQKTLLGWIVSGSLLVEPQTSKATICGLDVNEQLNENLARFWQIEHTQRQNTRTPEERIREGHFAQTYTRNSDGRFKVTLPTKQGELHKLGESRDIALRRFGVLERRLERDPQLKMVYANFIHEYLELKHMRELKSEDAAWYRRPHYYLPHHCVIKEASNTTRLRVVFDASSKTTSGYSLNDVLMVGPVLQQELFSILVRLRGFEYVLTADIAKMYRQVLLNEAQVSLQRIVWRDQPSEDIKTYELLTLTYGTASASFLATKVIQQLADLEEDHFPKGAAIARRDFYIDDLITGANSKEEAIIIRDQTIALLQKGGFTLRKWSSNSQELLKGLPEASTDNNILELDKDGTAKTLGIKWNPEKDVFQYTIALETPARGVCTKRSILASISQIFDPLGLLGPVIVNAKLIIQKLWKLKIDWDESLPSEIHTEWLDYVIKMQDLGGIAYPARRSVPALTYSLTFTDSATQVNEPTAHASTYGAAILTVLYKHN
ncbi:PREDICTED: uncharacterized protein LOC105555783 [Vollenhovia emeryi]|uniref:uncharacterized protein LOC105555783 n=1 Tax=Vollenhovia emeryi TaxID=411798 RepID=UPI0005F51B91|nr:PREDICTED: uncharacterized protein LOC105555783 [Vollenhovia emeryi]